MDRLPTAKIIKQENNKIIIKSEVYGKDIIMLILSQAIKVKVLSSDSPVEQIRKEIYRMYNVY